MTLYFKSCPKCHGDQYIGEDIYGAFLQCIQCGMLIDIDEKTSFLEKYAKKDPSILKAAVSSPYLFFDKQAKSS